jgi:hypothetical protein
VKQRERQRSATGASTKPIEGKCPGKHTTGHVSHIDALRDGHFPLYEYGATAGERGK